MLIVATTLNYNWVWNPLIVHHSVFLRVGYEVISGPSQRFYYPRATKVPVQVKDGFLRLLVACRL